MLEFDDTQHWQFVFDVFSRNCSTENQFCSKLESDVLEFCVKLVWVTVHDHAWWKFILMDASSRFKLLTMFFFFLFLNLALFVIGISAHRIFECFLLACLIVSCDCMATTLLTKCRFLFFSFIPVIRLFVSIVFERNSSCLIVNFLIHFIPPSCSYFMFSTYL